MSLLLRLLKWHTIIAEANIAIIMSLFITDYDKIIIEN